MSSEGAVSSAAPALKGTLFAPSLNASKHALILFILVEKWSQPGKNRITFIAMKGKQRKPQSDSSGLSVRAVGSQCPS